MWRLWMNQSYFSLGFLSQNSFWKLFKYRGYKGLYIVRWERMRKVSFSQTGWSGDLASRLGWVASSSYKLTAWPAWEFCHVVQQLAWLFSSLACFTRVPPLATLQSRASRKIQLRGSSWVHTLKLFITLSHTLPLHDSHLNTRFLNVELQANLTWNKTNKLIE